MKFSNYYILWAQVRRGKFLIVIKCAFVSSLLWWEKKRFKIYTHAPFFIPDTLSSLSLIYRLLGPFNRPPRAIIAPVATSRIYPQMRRDDLCCGFIFSARIYDQTRVVFKCPLVDATGPHRQLYTIYSNRLLEKWVRTSIIIKWKIYPRQNKKKISKQHLSFLYMRVKMTLSRSHQ